MHEYNVHFKFNFTFKLTLLTIRYCKNFIIISSDNYEILFIAAHKNFRFCRKVNIPMEWLKDSFLSHLKLSHSKCRKREKVWKRVKINIYCLSFAAATRRILQHPIHVRKIGIYRCLTSAAGDRSAHPQFLGPYSSPFSVSHTHIHTRGI